MGHVHVVLARNSKNVVVIDMSKKEVPSNDLLVADALLRLKSLENVLIAKGVLTKEELIAETEAVTRQIAKQLLQSLNVPGDLDDLLKSITDEKLKN